MGLIIATTGADFMSAEHDNIASDLEGTVRLAPLRNLVPDPNMYDFEADGQLHRYWDLLEPPRPTHWTVYARDRTNVRNFSRQKMAPMPLSESTYQQIDELFRGSGPIDPSNAIDIASPDDPRLSTFQVGQHIGFPAGWVTVAFGWILGPRHWMRSPYFTPPGARSEAIEIAQGQGVQITLPDTEIPAGVEGIMVYMNYPAASATAAGNSTLYAIERQPAKTFRSTARMFGPFTKGRPASIDENRSYWGANLPEPRAWNTTSRFHHKKMIQVQLSYTLFSERDTSSESSAVHPSKAGFVHTAPPGKNRVNFRPKRFPFAARQWQPEVRFYIDNEWSDWYKIVKKGSNNGRFNRGEKAEVIVADPEKWYEEAPTHLVKLGKKSEVDATGLQAPEEGLEIPSLIDLKSSGLTAGRHQFKTSLFVQEEEGRVSNPASIQVAAGQGVNVRRPLFHNKMPNSNASEITRDDPDVPVGWQVHKPFATGMSVRRIQGGMRVTDNRGSTSLAERKNAFTTPFGHLLTNQNTYTVRFRVSTSNYTGGISFAWLQEYDNNEQLINETQVARFRGQHNSATTLRLQRRTTDPENPNVIAISPATALVKLRVETFSNGAGKSGPTGITYDFTHWGVFEGWGDPRAIADDKLAIKRSGNKEVDENEFPHGGYCVIVEEPEDKPKLIDADVLQRDEYDNGIPSGFQTFQDGSTTNRIVVRPNENLVGTHALRMNKNDATNTRARNYIYKDFLEADSSLALGSDVYINKYSMDGITGIPQLFLGGIKDVQGRTMANLLWNANTQSLILTMVDDSGGSTDVVGVDVDLREKFSFELHVFNGGTANGTVRMYIGRHTARRELVVQHSGLDWSTRTPRTTELGVNSPGNDATRNYDVWFDRLVVSLNSTENYVQQDGNYIEYYGPPRTPRNDHYGPEGMKIPVKPNTTYTLGANLWYRDIEIDSSLLRFSSMDRRGQTDKNHGPLVRELVGDSNWKRVFKTFRTGLDTRYVEFYGNVLGAGTVKIHGVGLEEGTGERPFSGKNERSGYFAINLSTQLPDIISQTDPVYSLGEVSRYRDIQVIGTTDDETSYSVEYRGGSSINTLGPPVNDWTELDKRNSVVQVRVDMSTSNELNSPEIEEVQLDVARPVSQLCRADGTEYDGGVIVRDIGAVLPIRSVENVELASGRLGKTTRGEFPVRWLRNFTIEAHRDHTVTEIIRSYGEGNSEFVLEQDDKRYTIIFEELPEFSVKPKSRIRRGNRTDFVVHEATGVNAYIVGVENNI